MKSKQSIGWFLESSPAWRFFIQGSLNQPNTTHVCICLMNQSNCSISVCLLFLFCLRVFISRSYKNRSKMNQWRLKLILTIWKNQTAPQGAKKVSFAACFWGKLNLACTIQKVSLTYAPPPTQAKDWLHFYKIIWIPPEDFMCKCRTWDEQGKPWRSVKLHCIRIVASAGHYFVGKLRTEFTSPMAKYTSLRISDTTFFVRCPVDHWL